MKRRLVLVGSLLLGTLIGGLLLWLVVRRLDMRAVWEVLREADWLAIVAALLAMVSMWIVKAVRWIAILRGVAQLRLTDALAAVVVGAAGNVVVSHAGEALRILVAGRRCGGQTEVLLTSIAVEHAFDCAVIFLMVSAAILLGNSGRPAHLEWILGMLALGMIGTFLVVLRVGPRFADWIDKGSANQFSPLRVRLAGSLRRVVAALRLFGNPSQSLIVMSWTALMWVSVSACIYHCVRAVSGEVTLAATILVLGVHSVALLLPAPPAKVGLTQASFALALAGTALSSPRIFAASVIYNVLMTIPVLIAGMIAWHAARIRSVSAQLTAN